ncbi:hypothetical protein VST7929_02083 [Vibrio stylophorae]|uniref:DUF2897 domain-containing protein n=1 Tax=Vibrio stylophorae TaxID=659351 RepID=A0ABM8ZVC9_9VIBR|nr:hypothetical protein [Vibrio stylophorae]CAH0534175.1 hypothetical protein VST7929_02083 [Vibrio stylophorae]
MEWITNPWFIGFIVFGFIVAQMVTFWQAPKPKLPDNYLARKEKDQAELAKMQAEAAQRRAKFEQQQAQMKPTDHLKTHDMSDTNGKQMDAQQKNDLPGNK